MMHTIVLYFLNAHDEQSKNILQCESIFVMMKEFSAALVDGGGAR